MKSLIGSLIGLMLSVSVSADLLLEGQVRLSSGQPAAGVQVRLFDLTDLRRFVSTTTDEVGHFALPLRAFSTDRGTALPTDFALGQNYPNPFNPSTIIPYQIPTSTHVRLEVFNMLGQHLATLVDGERSAGVYTTQWDGTDAAGQAVGAGMYIYRLSSGGLTVSQRMVLVDGQAGVPRAGVAPEPLPSAVASSLEADSPVFGLTVTGEGLVAYVDPAFQVGADGASIVVERHDGVPRMKHAANGILGDVNDNGQVDGSDVLIVLLYSGDPSIALPNNGDISLGDVNRDGTVDFADTVLLARYISDPSHPTLPIGIGAPVGPVPALAHIYWTDWVTHKIQRASLDGSNIEILVVGLDDPGGLALDMTEGQIFWMDTGSIYRANLDGSNIETLITGLTNPSAIALDVDGSKMYWVDVSNWWMDESTSKIQRADLDGSNIETLCKFERKNPVSLCLNGQTSNHRSFHVCPTCRTHRLWEGLHTGLPAL